MVNEIHWYTVEADGRALGVIPKRRLLSYQKSLGESHGIAIRPATPDEQKKFGEDIRRNTRKKRKK